MMIERIYKMIISIIAMPIILAGLCMVACLILTLPIIALIRPDIINLGEE